MWFEIFDLYVLLIFPPFLNKKQYIYRLFTNSTLFRGLMKALVRNNYWNNGTLEINTGVSSLILISIHILIDVHRYDSRWLWLLVDKRINVQLFRRLNNIDGIVVGRYSTYE